MSELPGRKEPPLVLGELGAIGWSHHTEICRFTGQFNAEVLDKREGYSPHPWFSSSEEGTPARTGQAAAPPGGDCMGSTPGSPACMLGDSLGHSLLEEDAAALHLNLLLRVVLAIVTALRQM